MPKLSIFYCLLICLIISKASAQNSSTNSYEMKTDTVYAGVLPDAYIQILDDTLGKLTISDVSRAAMQAKFEPMDKRNKVVKKGINNYWLRYRIKNTMNRPIKLMLYANNGVVEFYRQLPGGKWKKQTTGRDTPYDSTDGFKRYFCVYYEIQPGEDALFYKHTYLDDFNLSRLAGNGQLGVNFGNFDAYAKIRLLNSDELLRSEKEMWLVGFMLLAGIITIIFYVLIKDWLYLYFGIAVLCFAFISENVAYDLFFRNHPVLYRYIGENLVQAIFVFCLWRFFDLFFDFGKTFPRIGKLMVVLTVILSVVSYIAAIIPGRVTDSFGVLGITYTLLAAAIVIVCLFNRKTTSNKKLLTVLPFLTACLLAFLNRMFDMLFGRSLSGEIVGEVFLSCICWLVISFMWTFLDRLLNTIRESEAERTRLVQEQNIQLELKVEERTAALQTSLENLKTTQRQLIQSEKMASLGELTAGIAHEIQNPLNFINNFSEVSVELIAEMNGELKTGNVDEGMQIAADIETNLQKINSHGKRADAIVKGMLQHSRTSSDKKEPTDINALCDEYLRLSYHGLRAKDKSFNAALDTDFASNLPKPDLVSQDIGRVMLNLFTNAFYSVTEKKKLDDKFAPRLSVSTIQNGNYIEIKVRDNGMGIPQSVVDKIYQPFFTTKPTGQGTGLGLSLSYDIITKMHGGELIVNTVEGEFAEFLVRLPVR